MNSYKIEKANDIPDAQPSTGQYDKDAIRVGALELTVARQRATMRAQRAEIERLNAAIEALEQEGLSQDFIDRHNACETPRSGQRENFWN